MDNTRESLALQPKDRSTCTKSGQTIFASRSGSGWRATRDALNGWKFVDRLILVRTPLLLTPLGEWRQPAK
jgi:hypothetical protein